MKRVLSLFLSLAIVFSFIVPVSAATETYTDTAGVKWYYEDKGDYIKIGGSNLPLNNGVSVVVDEVTVPSVIDGKPVTVLQNAMYYKANTDNSESKSNCNFLAKAIVIPNSVTNIGQYSFRAQGQISEVTIPNSVTIVGDNVFADCSSLTTVAFESPSVVTSIGKDAFLSCSKLENIVFPESLTIIKDTAFKSTKLSSITIPGNVTTIGTGAFFNTGTLKTITFEGMTAPGVTSASSEKRNFGSSETVYYPAGATGYTDPTFQSNFKEGTEFIPVGVAPATTVIDEINDGDDVTFDEDFDADGATATMTSGQVVDIGSYTLSNATVNVGSGTLIINGTTITGTTVELDEYGKIIVANGNTAYMSKGSSQGILTSFNHDGSATIDYTITRSGDSMSKDVSVPADGIASGSRVLFGLSVNNIPDGTTLTFTKN